MGNKTFLTFGTCKLVRVICLLCLAVFPFNPPDIQSAPRTAVQCGNQKSPCPFAGEPAQLNTASGVLRGVLLIPLSGKKKMPLAIIVADAGPADRNGNAPDMGGRINNLKMLSEGLAQRGIASLRYDKRGSGESRKAGADEKNMRFDTFVGDAEQWGRELLKDARFGPVVYIGHGEGALISILCAQRVRVGALVSVAGYGRPAWEIMLDELRPQADKEFFKQIEQAVGDVREGRFDTPALANREITSVLPENSRAYLHSLFRYNPEKEMGKLTVPALIVMGTSDNLTGLEDAEGLYKANPAAKIVLIEGMNHILKDSPPDDESIRESMRDPSLPVMPELIDIIADFIGGL